MCKMRVWIKTEIEEMERDEYYREEFIGFVVD